MGPLKRYSALATRHLSQALVFRAEVLLWALLNFLPLVILLLVWQSVYAPLQTGATVNSYSLSALVQYYFLGSIITLLSGAHFENWRVAEIRQGKIDFYLTRPLSYPVEVIIQTLSEKLIHLGVMLPPQLVGWWLVSSQVALSLPQASWSEWLTFALLLAYAFAVELAIGFATVCVGFWLEGAEGLEHFKWLTISLLSGSIIPLSFLPAWLAVAVDRLPFKYMYAYPIGVVQQTHIMTRTDWAVASGFLLVLASLCALLWRKAQLQYASHGG